MTQEANIERVDNGWIVIHAIPARSEVFLDLESALTCVAKAVQDCSWENSLRVEKILIAFKETEPKPCDCGQPNITEKHDCACLPSGHYEQPRDWREMQANPLGESDDDHNRQLNTKLEALKSEIIAQVKNMFASRKYVDTIAKVQELHREEILKEAREMMLDEYKKCLDQCLYSVQKHFFCSKHAPKQSELNHDGEE